MGPVEGIGALLAGVSEPRFYASVRTEVLELLRWRGYRIEDERRMLRMVLGGQVPEVSGDVSRMGARDRRGLEALHTDREYRGFFVPEMLEAGVYCGVREGEAWAAVAGNLRRMGIGTIVLNVEESNAQAVRVYERLGFRQHREYREAVAVRG